MTSVRRSTTAAISQSAAAAMSHMSSERQDRITGVWVTGSSYGVRLRPQERKGVARSVGGVVDEVEALDLDKHIEQAEDPLLVALALDQLGDGGPFVFDGSDDSELAS